MSSQRPSKIPESLIPKLIYYTWKLLWKLTLFTFKEFKHFFSTPQQGVKSKNFRETTRYNLKTMSLWCAVGIAIIQLIYYTAVISNPRNLPNFEIRFEGLSNFIILKNFNYNIAQLLQQSTFHIVGFSVFALFLVVWLYVHYSCHQSLEKSKSSEKMSMIFCIIFVIGNNAEGLTSLSSSFANVWLIMAPIIIIPAVGNRRSLPLLIINLVLHHLMVGYIPDPHNFLTSITSLFVAIFIMMTQMEYYRREFRLYLSNNQLREGALEIELIKENIDSGLMLLDLELKIRPNFNDMCVKLLHKKTLLNKNFIQLLLSIIKENQHFINSMSYSRDPEGDDYNIENLEDWEIKVRNYFEMLKSEQLSAEELSLIDPLKYIKIYSYEGRNYVSFHVSAIKVHNQIEYFMVLISNDTGKVAGRYRIMEHERKHIEKAQLLFALSHSNPMKQLASLNSFAKDYLEFCQNVLTEIRNTVPHHQLVETVRQLLLSINKAFEDLNLHKCVDQASELLQKCQEFNQINLDHSNNAIIINKSVQVRYIQLIVDCERFLHEMGSLFHIATFFIREPSLAEELQRQKRKQTLHYGLSQDTLKNDQEVDFLDTQLSQGTQIFVNLYAAFEILLNQHDLRHELELVEQKFHSHPELQDTSE